MKTETRQDLFAVIAAFSFLALSAYLVLWRDSNRNLAIAGTAALIFLLAIVFSPRKDVSICAALLFSGIRYAVGAIVTHELRAILATIVFLGVPAVIVMLDSRRQHKIPMK